ncbi:MAG TPA: hypothetical protein VF950_07760 [Planctomycetota bacterium]
MAALTLFCLLALGDESRWALSDPALHQDFPDLCLDADGTAWIAYLRHDGKADTVRLAKKGPAGLEDVAALSEPGVAHQPAIARDGSGGLWVFWGQLGPKNVVRLHARSVRDGKPGELLTLAASDGSDTFADAGTDAAGRVWVVWQSLRAGQADVFARYYDPANSLWSPEIAVAADEAGDWEPRVAFDGKEGAWVVFDSSRGGEFNIYAARVELDGKVATKKITDSPDYEGRVSTTSDGRGGLWIAFERGKQRWGRDLRGHDAPKGLNGQKRAVLGRFDPASGTFTETPPFTPILSEWLKEQLKGKKLVEKRLMAAVNLPALGVDGAGHPWIACRYYSQQKWQIAVARFDAKRGVWSKPQAMDDSTFGQDRRTELVRDAQGKLWACWPSDRRTNKDCGVPAIFVRTLDVAPPDAEAVAEAPLPEPEPYLDPTTPDRARSDRHTWSIGGKTYQLYWGDFHRHTDVSNCITGNDGCVTEQFRYAYDVAKLDFLGTSDHTDVGKVYAPYEWWHNQRMVEVFYSPNRFLSMYAYEREQKWPWGHRNVIFAQRGGPVVHIQRKNYKNSPWQALYPAGEGGPELMPEDLWSILKAYGKPVSVISHTGASTMGTDWDLYKQIDAAVENLVEIYQGARVSYEGLGAPQPTVGLERKEKYNPATNSKVEDPPAPISDFGKYNKGVYQNALRNGHKLGVFASSDHISTHTSFGGVYVETFTREGILEALNARRTVAGTDKIFVEFSCDGHPLGSTLDTAALPKLAIAVRGTSALKRVTLVRNEKDFKIFEPAGKDFATTFEDAAPIAGENRYYVRVEQADGNMAWASPVWVTVKK